MRPHPLFVCREETAVKDTDEKVITALEPAGGRQKRLTVHLDGEPAMEIRKDVAKAIALTVGQSVRLEHLKEQVREETLNRARDRAFLMLSVRNRSEREIVDRLRQACYEPDIIEEVVEILRRLDYLNDRSFAEEWLKSRMDGRKMGRRGVAWELRRKGVQADIVEEVTSACDDETERATALEAARRRWPALAGDDPRAARRRLAGFLQRRGFSWDTIHGVLEDICPPGDAES